MKVKYISCFFWGEVGWDGEEEENKQHNTYPLPRKNRTTTGPEPRANTHGGQCFFPSELSPDFYFKKTLATNNKGVFNLRLPKSDSNFFFGGRVSPHLCLLAAVLRAP
jgi:hypothetical protein